MGIDERRTILVELGKLRPISDIFGLYLIRIDNSREKRRELAGRLASARCPVDLEGSEWQQAGDFIAALKVFDAAPAADDSSPRLPYVGALVEIRVRHERLHIVSERHEYVLVVEVENVGSVTLTDYRVDILFPKVFMDIESYGFEVQRLETDTHKLIRRTAANFPEYSTGLYPGDTLVDKLIKYSVIGQRYWNDLLMELPVVVTVVADGMVRQQVQQPLRELQNF
jgi:hypothetical protein